jgi:hypothetical protein
MMSVSMIKAVRDNPTVGSFTGKPTPETPQPTVATRHFVAQS